MLPLAVDFGDGEFFFKDFEAPGDEGDELGLLDLNNSGEFVSDRFGSFKLDTTNSGEERETLVRLIDDDVGEAGTGSHRM